MGRKRKGNDEQQFFTWDYALGQLDKNGDVPSVFMALSSVRGPGKTYDASSQMLKQFLGHPCKLAELIGTGREIGLICRTKKTLGHFAEGVLGQVITDKYPMSVIEEVVVGGAISQINWIFNADDEELKEVKTLGWVLPLNSRGYIKTVSSMLTKIGVILMDEMIPEKGDPYVPDEFGKLKSIMGSISRGTDPSPQALPDAVRYVAVLMAGNAITMDNPYFEGFGMTSNIQRDTILYRGNSLIYQRCDNKNAIKRQGSSRFNAAIKDNEDACDGFWNDDNGQICKPSRDWGPGRYDCTISYNGHECGIVYYREVGLYYVTHSLDRTCYNKYSLTASGQVNYAFIKSSRYFKSLREAIFNGCVRYQSMSCKNMFSVLKV